MTRHAATVRRHAIVGALMLAIAAGAAAGCPPTATTADTTVATGMAPVGAGLTDTPEAHPAASPGWSRAQGALVTLLVAVGSQMSAGTGIVLTADGVGLTNAHVVRGARRVLAHDLGNGRDYPATVLGADPVGDIAVIRLTGATNLEVARLGDSDALWVGQHVAAIGNVGGVGQATLSAGVITSLGRRVNSSDSDGGNVEHLRGMIETDAWVRPGDSGGALVTTAGQVIGVTTSSNTRHGYAIPLGHALAAAHQLAEFDTPDPRSGPELVDDRRGRGGDGPDRRGLLATDLKLGSSGPRRTAGDPPRPRRGRPLLAGRPGRGLLG